MISIASRFVAVAFATAVIAVALPCVAAAETPVEAAPKQVPPALIKRVEPEYPADARKRGAIGVVVVEFVVDATGTVANPKAIESPDESLSQAAVAAVKQWKFRPATIDGKPVKTRMRQRLTFGV